MNRPPFLSWLVYKELRALFWFWAAFALALVAAAVADEQFRLGGGGLIIYVLAAVVLGGMSIGLEYAQRTMGSWLALPVPRSRLLLTKLAVLGVMLGALGGLELSLYGSYLPARPWDRAAVILLPWACGVMIAPWMTLVGRSATAGAVFTAAIPALLVMGVTSLRSLFGASPGRFDEPLVVGGLLVLCGVGTWRVWRLTQRLEVSEHAEGDFFFPRRQPGRTAKRRERSRTARRHPLRLLISKEVRLHSLAFALAPIYLALVAVDVLAWGKGLTPVLSIGQILLTAIAVGACGISEERRWGTVEWQLLLPLSIRVQWVVKIGTMVGLVGVMGITLPLSVSTVLGFHASAPSIVVLGLVVLAVSAVAFYASSVCSGGMAAVVIGLATSALGGVLPTTAFSVSRYAGKLWHEWFQRPVTVSAGGRWLVGEFLRYETTLLVIGFVVLATVFALRNHRYSDLSPARLLVQVAVVALYLCAGVLIVGVTMSGVWLAGLRPMA